jgi:hypothetical protein
MVMIAIYFDDCLTIGTEEAIEKVIYALKGHNIGLKVEDNRNDCSSWKIFQESDKEMIRILQTHLIDNLENRFGGELCKVQSALC